MITHSARGVSLAAALFALAGCEESDDLTARGEVTATLDGASTGFSLDHGHWREAPRAHASLGRVTGDCSMRRVANADGQTSWGVIVSIRRGGEVDESRLASMTIMQRSDSRAEDGRVEAELGMTRFVSRNRCSVEMNYADAEGGMVGLTSQCEVADAAGNAARVTVELEIMGCDVV